MKQIDAKRASDLLEGYLREFESENQDFLGRVRTFESFQDTAFHLIQSMGLTDPGSALVFTLQDFKKTKSKEVLRARSLHTRANKINAPKKRMSEFYSAETEALFHMQKDMRAFLGALRERLPSNPV